MGLIYLDGFGKIEEFDELALLYALSADFTTTLLLLRNHAANLRGCFNYVPYDCVIGKTLGGEGRREKVAGWEIGELEELKAELLEKLYI